MLQLLGKLLNLVLAHNGLLLVVDCLLDAVLLVTELLLLQSRQL